MRPPAIGYIYQPVVFKLFSAPIRRISISWMAQKSNLPFQTIMGLLLQMGLCYFKPKAWYKIN